MFIGPSLFLEGEKILVLGDLHIGSDYALSSAGAFSPILGLTEIEETIGKILSKIETKIEKIVLLGDICNNFGSPSFSEVKAINEIFEILKAKCENIILIKGNHDRFIEKIMNELEIEFVEKYEQGEYCFIHGDKISSSSKQILIIGHEHPAIKLSNGIRNEKYKCFIESEYQDQKLIMLPSLNMLSIGTNILNDKLLSPYLTEDVLDKAKIFVVEGLDVLDFGKLNKITS